MKWLQYTAPDWIAGYLAGIAASCGVYGISSGIPEWTISAGAILIASICIPSARDLAPPNT